MREALLILRKDIRRQRVIVAVFLLLTAVRTAVDIVLPRQPELVALQAGLTVAYLIGLIGLIHAAVHQERIIGTDQYWLTRPFAWSSILGSKLLFLTIVVMLPACLSAALALAVNGVSPVRGWALEPLLVIGVFTLAVASVTRTVTQLVLTIVALLILMVLSTVTMTWLFGYEAGSWGSAGSVRSNADLLLFLALLAAGIVLQYRRSHSVAVARFVICGAALVTLIGLPGWHAAFAYLERTHGPGASAPVRLEFDAARGPQERQGGWSYWAGEDVVGFKLPVDVTGIPPHATLIAERVRTSIEAPGGRRWDSGWRVFGGITGDQSEGAALQHIEPDHGRLWVGINVDRKFHDSVHLDDMPVRVRITAAFTILSSRRVLHLPVPVLGYRVTPDVFCSVLVSNRSVTVPCVSAQRSENPDPEHRIYALGKSDERVELTPSLATPSMSAWSYSSTASFIPTFSPTAVEVEVRDDPGYFERTFTVESLRLRPFEVGRSDPAKWFGETVRVIR
jgi:hypothetical protein